jgi:hypothetical protein
VVTHDVQVHRSIRLKLEVLELEVELVVVEQALEVVKLVVELAVEHAVEVVELAAVKRIGGVVELVLLVHAFYCGAIWVHVVVAS